MDVWVVAAAAGAGYVAQRLKNLTSGKHSSLDSSSHNFLGNVEIPGKSYRFHRFSEEPFAVELSTGREQACNEASAAEMALDRLGSESLETLDSCANSSAFFISNSSDLNNESVQGDFDTVDGGDSLPQPSSGDMGFSFGFRRNRSSLRNKRLKSQFIKPRTSLESCLIAQLYKEHAGIEEYTYYEHPSNKPTVRPFLVSDGSKIISRTNRESLILTEAGILGLDLEKDICVKDNKTVVGVPSLPSVVHVDIKNKVKAETGKQQVLKIKSCEMDNRDHINAQGSSDGTFLFYLGLTTGMVSTFLANKREMENLNQLLKQNENLVQDLQDEIELKDSLTVKELAMDDYESHDMPNSSNYNDNAQALSLDQKLDNSSKESEKLCDRRIGEESMSTIEAELEAELERLESTINSSRLERKIFNMAELDPDFVSDATVGELRADLFGTKNGNQLYRNENNSSTPYHALYPVDPKELSLRLHEVLQSRLEERVKELEMALRNSQSEVTEFPETPTIEYPTVETTRNSADDEPQSLDHPVVINLSGEALSAYNEVYDALSKLSDSDDEDLGRGFESIEHQEHFHFCKEVTNQVQNCGFIGNAASSVSDGTPQTEISCRMGNDLYADVDENEDGDDEMERLLIRQIVDRARQGSPAVLKAQRALVPFGLEFSFLLLFLHFTITHTTFTHQINFFTFSLTHTTPPNSKITIHLNQLTYQSKHKLCC